MDDGVSTDDDFRDVLGLGVIDQRDNLFVETLSLGDTGEGISSDGEQSLVLTVVNDGLELGDGSSSITNNVPELLVGDILSELGNSVNQTISVGSTVF